MRWVFRAAGSSNREAFAAFDIGSDYRRHVDGKPRSHGVRDFLASRGIELPFGVIQHAPDTPSVHVFGKLKDQYFAPIKLAINDDVYEFVCGSTRVFKLGSQPR